MGWFFTCSGVGRIAEKHNYANVVVFEHDENQWHKNIDLVLPSADHKLVVSYSTITTAIHLAAYMGAKNILIVGHDCGTLDGECNFEGYHTDATYKIAWPSGKSGYKNWLPKIEGDTIRLKKLLYAKYGCCVYSINPFINFGLEGHKYTFK